MYMVGPVPKKFASQGRVIQSATVTVRKSTDAVTGEPGPPPQLPDELEKARASLEHGLRDLITRAKAGDTGAAKKLKIFGSVSDPALATRLALMNNGQRRAYLANARAERGRRSALKNGGAKKRGGRT